MNREFLAACNYFVKSTTLTHQQQVCRLYRDCLKTAFSWASTRDLYLKDAQKIREEFRKNAALDPESAEAKKLLADGQKRLEEHRHPDQYIICWGVGGSKYMRNAPPPLEVCYPHGVPKEVAESVIPVHPDQVPYNWRPNNEEIMIDFNGKKMI